MIKGKRKTHLTVENVLKLVTEYDIFRWYMPEKGWKLNSVTLSPFRRERNPSFLIGTKHGRISFIDFADTSLRGDCFDFVRLLFNLPGIGDALLLIDKDFGLGLADGKPTHHYKKVVGEYKQPANLSKRYVLIQAKTRKFTKEELSYWNQYHQSEDDLKANGVYSIKELYLNKEKFPLKETELRFGYLYDGHWKIYRPFGDKKTKWVPNNVPITMMDGREDIKNCELAFNEKFYATTVFIPVLANEMRGANNVEICAIESFDIPEYSSQEDAVASLGRLSIPDEDRESTWKYQEMFDDYINQHSRQDAQRLGGAYGIKDGVQILPVSRTTDAVDVKALPARDELTGEDQSL